MKYYTAFKSMQGIFMILFFSVFIIFSSKSTYKNGYLFFLFSGLIICLAFLALDLVCWKQCKKREYHFALMTLTDSLTQLPNSSAVRQKIIGLSHSLLDDDTACVIISFENIHKLNRTYGHEAGDATLHEFGEILCVASSDLCFTGRKGGRTFLSIFEGNARKKADLFLKRLERGVTIHNEAAGLLPISYSVKTVCNEEFHYASIYDLVKIR